MPVDANNPQTAEFAKLIDQVDVSKQFDQFRTAGTLKGQAPETLDGVQTTRYDITVDVAKARGHGAERRGPQAAGATHAGRGEDPRHAGLGRRGQAAAADQDVVTPPQGQNATATIKLSDWGAPVTVEAPPAGEVQELPAGN